MLKVTQLVSGKYRNVTQVCLTKQTLLLTNKHALSVHCILPMYQLINQLNNIYLIPAIFQVQLRFWDNVANETDKVPALLELTFQKREIDDKNIYKQAGCGGSHL